MKLFVRCVTFFLFISVAQNASSVTVQNDSSKAVPGTIIEDEELILGDDEDIRKATIYRADTSVAAPAQSPSTDDKAVKAKDDMVDSELKLDGGEESLFENVKTKSEVNDDSMKVTGDSVTASAGVKLSTDAVETSDTLSVQQSTIGQDKEVDSVISTAKEQPRIEKTNSINFAHNLKEYRSPKLAMLLSLLVPGAGQVYAKDNSWKAAIFGAVEVGMIATSIAIRYNGKEKEKAAHKFADNNYSYQQYRTYQDTILPNLVPNDTVFQNIFAGGMDTSFQNAAFSKDNDFYKYIKDNDQPFVRGWKDVTPAFVGFVAAAGYTQRADSAYLVYPDGGDSTKATYGYSKYQETYRTDISDANGLFRASGLVLRLMIINHIISAIDAGFAAKAHNDQLLRKESFWQHVNIEQMYVTTGKGAIPGFALKVRF